jgi:hypothetical protein
VGTEYGRLEIAVRDADSVMHILECGKDLADDVLNGAFGQ